MDPLNLLIVVAMGAVLVVLLLGLINLVRGGDAARSRSNKLMRLRVLTQFVAVVVLLGVFWWRTQGGGAG